MSTLAIERPTTSTAYQWRLTALLSVSFGFVLFDRNALSFLMPFVQPELQLSNTEVGVLSGGLSLTLGDRSVRCRGGCRPVRIA
jgi:sugar phosphate permease